MKRLPAVFALALLAISGCGAMIGGNVFSDGYRDGYIVGVAEKRQGMGGLSYVGEIKVSFHGYGGGAVDPAAEGQTPNGAWTANFYDDKVMTACEAIRGDQLVRLYYKEKDVHFSGGTKYEITRVEVLPPAGELSELNKEEK